MPKYDAFPGEPIEWQDTYAYANELIKEGILDRETVTYQFSMFNTNESEKAFEWLVNTASRIHMDKFEEDHDDISVSFFNDDNNDRDATVELKNYLESNYEGPISKRKIGSLVLRLAGATLWVFAGLGMVKQLSETGNLLSDDMSESIPQSLFVIIGSLLIAKGMDMDEY